MPLCPECGAFRLRHKLSVRCVRCKARRREALRRKAALNLSPRR